MRHNGISAGIVLLTQEHRGERAALFSFIVSSNKLTGYSFWDLTIDLLKKEKKLGGSHKEGYSHHRLFHKHTHTHKHKRKENRSTDTRLIIALTK